MSFEFLVAARAITALEPTQKHVYLTLASHADATGLCWPSIATLARETGLNTRTVQRALAVIAEKNLVQRKDRWMRSTLYWITPDTAAANHPVENTMPSVDNLIFGRIGIATSTPAETTPYTPALATPYTPALTTPIELQSEIPPELPRIGAQTKVPVKKDTPAAKSTNIVLVDDIPQDLLADWQAVRASKHQKVLTATAMQALRDEAAKAGLSAAEAIRQCVISNWARFEARWLTPHPAETTVVAPAAPVRPPEPEVAAAPPSPEILARIAAIKATPVEPKDPKAKARATIARKTAGEHISRASLEFACFVLGIKNWQDAAKLAD